ncbi:hypothetical protein KR200_011303, partial [Drosophila serrata]
AQLVELLVRNAKPSLQHELLHLKILNRAQLRYEVRRHEQFYNNLKTFKPKPFRSYVAELTTENEETGLKEVDEEINQIQRRNIPTCWNCDKQGHRFDDFLSSDQRLYTDIPIEGHIYKALLDSGASISCLGGLAAQNLLKHKNAKKCFGVIKTANGTKSKVVSRNSTRIKSCWQNVKQCRIGIECISSLPTGPKDPRSFLQINMLGRVVYGLLDSGASISCVGGNLAREVMTKGGYKAINSNATTADGRSQQILGYLKADVEYSDVK